MLYDNGMNKNISKGKKNNIGYDCNNYYNFTENNDGCNQETENKACQFKIPYSVLSLPPEQFTVLATVLGFLLSHDLTIDQQNSLGNFFQAIGQTIVTYAGQKDLYEELKKINKQKSSSD